MWSDVTTRDKFQLHVSSDFLAEINAWANAKPGVRIMGIEGFRARGRDKRQDQSMDYLVQKLAERLYPSQVVDNTDIKNIVKEDLLELFHCKRFPGTNHADSKSAARVALRTGIANPAINLLLSDYVRDHLDGKTWAVVARV